MRRRYNKGIYHAHSTDPLLYDARNTLLAYSSTTFRVIYYVICSYVRTKYIIYVVFVCMLAEQMTCNRAMVMIFNEF